MALTYSKPGELGSLAIEFSLPGTDGKTYRLTDFTQSKALVFVFMCNHCPYVIATDVRINRLAQERLAKGVRFVGISSNDATHYPKDSFEAMKVRAKEQGYVFPYLYDEDQSVAKAYDAVCTPEFYVYANEGGSFVLRYKGRLDDNWKDESAVTQHDLADALTQIEQGSAPAPESQKPAMGCSIKWKK